MSDGSFGVWFVAKCRNCGEEVPQDDIDAGLAFADGDVVYCKNCVRKVLGELGRLRKQVEHETDIETISRHIEMATPPPSQPQRTYKWLVFVLLMLVVFGLAVLAFLLLL